MTRRTERVDLPAPAPGTARHLVVHRWGRDGARPKAYLQAAIHADEWPAMLALDHLARRLDAADVTGEVVLVPAANPVGLAQQFMGAQLGRFAFDATGNFNRGFPDLAAAAAKLFDSRTIPVDGPAAVDAVRAALLAAVGEMPRDSETEALKATLLGLAIDADLVLDVHCDGEALLHLYASQHHRDIAEALAGELGAAVCLLETDPGGTPFDEACAKPWWSLRALGGAFAGLPLACFATTVELRGKADVADELAADDAERLLRFLQRRGVVTGDPGRAPAPLAGTFLRRSTRPRRLRPA